MFKLALASIRWDASSINSLSMARWRGVLKYKGIVEQWPFSKNLQGDQDHFLCKEMLITPLILKLHKNPWIWEGLRTIHFI